VEDSTTRSPAAALLQQCSNQTVFEIGPKRWGLDAEREDTLEPYIFLDTCGFGRWTFLSCRWAFWLFEDPDPHLFQFHMAWHTNFGQKLH
jgi:hypothetical protein